MNSELKVFFDHVRPAIDSTLDALLPAESVSPQRIHQAMRYSTLNGGKRVRPCLCVAAFAAYKEDWEPVLPIASAIEMIHSYSLIHDDLPAMDDDDFRRGKPSCHKQFDEATAILAGDALLTLAFETLSKPENFSGDRLLRVVAVLGAAAGTPAGMVAGQVLDLEAESKEITIDELSAIHRSKTGALIRAAVWIGAYLGGASERDLASIQTYCDRIGLAFQVIDDILDATDGENRDEGKATYPAFCGLEKSRAIAGQLMADARQSLVSLSGRPDLLLAFCDYLENRTH